MNAISKLGITNKRAVGAAYEVQNKHDSIKSSLDNLGITVGRLLDFVDKIEFNNTNVSVQTPEDTKEEKAMTLATLLGNLPNIIEEETQKIDSAIIRMKSLLF